MKTCDHRCEYRATKPKQVVYTDTFDNDKEVAFRGSLTSRID